MRWDDRAWYLVLLATDDLRDMFLVMRVQIEKVVELLRDGDDTSVEQALALLQNTVFSFSMRVCGHREDAEDTMQKQLAKNMQEG